MMRRMMIVGFLVLAVALVACGGRQGAATVMNDAGYAISVDSTDLGMALAMRLEAGTLMLEDTPLAVTPAQAQELLPLRQMLGALQDSGTSSQLEVEAVLGQIQEAMTPDQLVAIEAMDQEEMQALVQEFGTGGQGGTDSNGVAASLPPDAMLAGVAGGPPAVNPDGLIDLGPDAQGALVTEGMESGSQAVSTDAVVNLLEARSAAL